MDEEIVTALDHEFSVRPENPSRSDRRERPNRPCRALYVISCARPWKRAVPVMESRRQRAEAFPALHTELVGGGPRSRCTYRCSKARLAQQPFHSVDTSIREGGSRDCCWCLEQFVPFCNFIRLIR